MATYPRPDVIYKEQSRNGDRHRQQRLLGTEKERRRDERSTGRIISFERIGHSLRREQDGSGKPNPAQREIQTAGYLGERSDFRVVNAAEPVGLHHAMP